MDIAKRAWQMLVLSAGFTLAGNAVGADTPDPRATVEEATDKLLSKLVEVKPLYETDPKQFYAEVEKSLAPFIDFEGFARGVMAKYYRRASDQQKKEFAKKFETQLIETYANALVEFDNQKVEVKPLKEPPQEGRVSVDIDIHGSSGRIYPIVYSLALIDGQWKLRNVIIDGINVGYQFRSQFANYMQQYRGDIDQVIANWNVDTDVTGT